MEPIYSLPLGKLGIFHVTMSIVIQWCVMLALILVALSLTSNLKKVPSRKQTVAELLYTSLKNFVEGNMGSNYLSYISFIGTIAIYILTMNLVPLLGFQAPTQDFNVPLGLALMVFVVVQGNAIVKSGVGGYLHAYATPMLPLTIMERIMVPVSMTLRLFGNIVAGSVIIDLVYEGLRHYSWFATLGIPVPLHGFFDIFDGTLQALIFTMLTMINIRVMAEH
ncbi:ATP synthase subunit a [Clostridium polyendosporum]|uniref:ATP synthase subunit a n=1 Tax=Clostridium polyendosporum TaxID=69208 RepID=A0A919S1F2_9CLOT|nr:F0F1 ATP synthase subunit A [Clostridium polyendosporum]GIM29674.1 ATP synthase subunit a [Clostridium polyendosporum]